ncbi:leucine-rich repeat domain-containing protein [Histomonas meleagridis]|uniref:leucine-rich repeat domain-containing protein n=1 Tax=Histomonas meleagridis TaxID=135588 RepID=UPI00355A71AB|nr:leucine-rich repeat domain-containing protein [Histomonas meleagridis]KAH0796477.1 leucine-rich repeat domain-containing protein [Histomonas meleagridis]
MTFSGCSNLKTVNIPTLGNLADYDFYACFSLESVSFPEVYRALGESFFAYCTSLVHVELSCCIRIGEYTFSGCTSLKNVSAVSLNTIGGGSFMGCTSLTNLTFLAVTTLEGGKNFFGCVNLECIILPILHTVRNCSFVFAGCEKLEVLQFSSIVMEFDKTSFWNLSQNIYLCLKEENQYAVYSDNCRQNNGTDCDNYWNGIKINVEDNTLRDKCKGLTNFNNDNDNKIVIIVVSVVVCLVVVVTPIILYTCYLYRKNKREKENIEKIPRVKISIYDGIL